MALEQNRAQECAVDAHRRAHINECVNLTHMCAIACVLLVALLWAPGTTGLRDRSKSGSLDFHARAETTVVVYYPAGAPPPTVLTAHGPAPECAVSWCADPITAVAATVHSAYVVPAGGSIAVNSTAAFGIAAAPCAGRCSHLNDERLGILSYQSTGSWAGIMCSNTGVAAAILLGVAAALKLGEAHGILVVAWAMSALLAVTRYASVFESPHFNVDSSAYRDTIAAFVGRLLVYMLALLALQSHVARHMWTAVLISIPTLPAAVYLASGGGVLPFVVWVYYVAEAVRGPRSEQGAGDVKRLWF